jgi:hypothetical protein
LLQLDENAVRARRVDERDQRPFGTGPWVFVDKPRAMRLQLRKRRGDVVDAQRDVVEPRTAFLDVFRDRRVGGCRLEQFEACVADG